MELESNERMLKGLIYTKKRREVFAKLFLLVVSVAVMAILWCFVIYNTMVYLNIYVLTNSFVSFDDFLIMGFLAGLVYGFFVAFTFIHNAYGVKKIR